MNQVSAAPLTGEGATQPADGDRVIESFAKASGRLLGVAPVLGEARVRAAVARARAAQKEWGALPVAERSALLGRFRDAILDHEEELTDLLSKETGKPKHEALLQEVAVIVNMLTHLGRRAEAILATREVELSLFKHRKSFLHYAPRGVIGIISPWNYPFNLPLRDAVLALFAGNGVVIKPSEVTPLIALKAKSVWDDSGLPRDLFQVVTGYGETGAALIDAGIDFLVFTGGVATGKRVAAACGERLIPCVMELGGKAPLIVCEDADVARAANAAVFGGFSNSGQICISVERVYAHERVHDDLLDQMATATRRLRQGDPETSSVDVGAITFPKQIEVAEAHVADAVKKGARVVVGGKRVPGESFFEPTILADCTHDMTVMRSEIFGPIVPVMRVASDEEATRLANDSHLGLNAYVFTKDREKGHRIARQIEAGSVMVNDVLLNGGMVEAPFGGIKESGFGRVMGDDALRDLCNVKHVVIDRIATSREPVWFPYDDRSLRVTRKAVQLVFGGRAALERLRRFFA